MFNSLSVELELTLIDTMQHQLPSVQDNLATLDILTYSINSRSATFFLEVEYRDRHNTCVKPV